MEVDLSQIDPETTTEMLLLQYAQKLERRVMALQEDKGYYPLIGPRKVFVDKVNLTEQNRYWHGMVRAELSHEFDGCMLKCYTNPASNKENKSFEVAVYVNNDRLKILSRHANLISELYREGLYKMAEIYNPKHRIR